MLINITGVRADLTIPIASRVITYKVKIRSISADHGGSAEMNDTRHCLLDNIAAMLSTDSSTASFLPPATQYTPAAVLITIISLQWA